MFLKPCFFFGTMIWRLSRFSKFWLTKAFSFSFGWSDFPGKSLFIFYFRVLRFYILHMTVKYIFTIPLLQIRIIYCVRHITCYSPYLILFTSYLVYFTYYLVALTWYLVPFTYHPLAFKFLLLIHSLVLYFILGKKLMQILLTLSKTIK